MTCPDPNRIAELVQGGLPPAESAQLTEHLSSCAACRSIVAGLVRSSLAPPAVEGPELARGASIGRFTLLQRIGTGAMGAVYAAFDPELDRKVALKVLHAESGQEQLVAEARAMARLAHPNVVPVLEIGTDQGRVFLAMEFVQGVTLRGWLQERRTQAEIVRVMMEAGRGLAAAHAVGLTHRDFKPENVLVGVDGRIRVTDFGLARAAPEAAAQGKPGVSGLAGTPAYMAPEQFRGAGTGPQADQFAFCVVLWEALYGEAPFDVGTPPSLDHLAKEVIAGRLRKPADALRVPAWLRRLLNRGLSVDPSDRFPSMSALLDALGKDPAGARRRLIVLSLSALAIAALSAGGYQVFEQRRGLCTGGESKLVGVWDAPRRDAMKAAFMKSGIPSADFAWARVERKFDEATRDWVVMHTEACEATRRRGEQSEEVLDLRMVCLSERLQEFSAASDLLATADKKIAERSVQITGSWSPLSRCADVDALRAPLRLPADVSIREKVAEARGEIARARTLGGAARYKDGLVLANSALERARASKYAPLEAEAVMQLGRLQMLAKEIAPAEHTLEDAFYLAESCRHDEVAAQSATLLLNHIGEQPGRGTDARRWGRLAKAVISRGASYPDAEAFLENSLAVLAELEGNYAEALEGFGRALALYAKVSDADDSRVASTHNAMGNTLTGLGQYAEAIESYQKAQAIQEKLRGPDHPNIAVILANTASVMAMVGRPDEAIANYRRAIEIMSKVLGPEHVEVATLRIDLGYALHVARKEELALAEEEAALPIVEKALGPDAPELARLQQNLGQIYDRLGKPKESVAAFQRAHELSAASLGADHPETATTLGLVGEGLLRTNDFAGAVKALTRSLEILDAKSPRPEVLAEFRFALAEALWEGKGDRARAMELAHKSRDGFAQLEGASASTKLAEIDTWLAAHPQK